MVTPGQMLDNWQVIYFGSGTLPGKMLLVRIIESDKIDPHFWLG